MKILINENNKYHKKRVSEEKDFKLSDTPIEKWLKNEIFYQNLACKNYKYVPLIFKIECENSDPIIYMTKIDGITLYDHILKGNIKTFEEKENLKKRLVGILKQFHRINMLHGDTNLKNYMIDLKGNIWVVDFGLSKTANGEYIPKKNELIRVCENIDIVYNMFLKNSK